MKNITTHYSDQKETPMEKYQIKCPHCKSLSIVELDAMTGDDEEQVNSKDNYGKTIAEQEKLMEALDAIEEYFQYYFCLECKKRFFPENINKEGN